MSDVNDQFNANMREQAELLAKKKALETHKVEEQFRRLEENRQTEDTYKRMSFAPLTAEAIETLRSENSTYIESARNSMSFIDDSFRQIVPFFNKNIILIGASTGEGKSTSSANIALSVIRQRKRCLVIVNEEVASDVYNRVTALIKGWSYNNHDSITREQEATYNDYYGKLAPMMTVVDNRFMGLDNPTTTLEGIEALFNKLKTDENRYDCIILDYIQKVDRSLRNPQMSAWQVMDRVMKFIDNFKGEYGAPIVVMAQLKAASKENEIPFKERIEGYKAIVNPVTCALEIRADKDRMRTEWVLHKGRFTSSLGKSFFTGWDRGRYVPYTADFQQKVDKIKFERLESSTEATNVTRTKE